MKIEQWEMTAAGEPLQRTHREVATLAADEALVRVAGCGVCHTDIGFLYDGVRTRHSLPLTLGHEISGVVEDAGSAVRSWIGEEVVVPAVIPCGACDLCRRGRGSICPRQVFPGNDIHGGFASHVVVPARGLCVIPGGTHSHGPDLALPDLAVLADAVTTPYQSIQRSGLKAGDLAVFIGTGGVGAFGVQIAAALGAWVAAIDIDPARLTLAAAHGASHTFDASQMEVKAIKSELLSLAKANNLPTVEWKIFETSGSKAGQETAFRLLNHGAYLGVIGFTRDSATVPLSHLMAFDARAEGNWGCLPELYPAALDLVLRRRIRLAPFVERHPLSHINQVMKAVHDRQIRLRPVLVPDFA